MCDYSSVVVPSSTCIFYWNHISLINWGNPKSETFYYPFQLARFIIASNRKFCSRFTGWYSSSIKYSNGGDSWLGLFNLLSIIVVFGHSGETTGKRLAIIDKKAILLFEAVPWSWIVYRRADMVCYEGSVPHNMKPNRRPHVSRMPIASCWCYGTRYHTMACSTRPRYWLVCL